MKILTMNLRDTIKVDYFEDSLDEIKISKKKFRHRSAFVTKEQLRGELSSAKKLVADLQSELKSTKESYASYLTSIARRNQETEDQLKTSKKVIESMTQQLKTFARTVRLQKSLIENKNHNISKLK